MQSGAELSGPQTEKTTVPVTVPFVPVRVATSVTDSPIVMWPLLPRLVEPCLTWVLMSAPTQNENVPEAKSDRVASTDCDDRVSAMNEVKQPASRPRFERLMPPSKSSPGRKSLLPDLSVKAHGEVSVFVFVAPHASSKAGAPVHGTPDATEWRCVPALPPDATHE